MRARAIAEVDPGCNTSPRLGRAVPQSRSEIRLEEAVPIEAQYPTSELERMAMRSAIRTAPPDAVMPALSVAGGTGASTKIHALRRIALERSSAAKPTWCAPARSAPSMVALEPRTTCTELLVAPRFRTT